MSHGAAAPSIMRRKSGVKPPQSKGWSHARAAFRLIHLLPLLITLRQLLNGTALCIRTRRAMLRKMAHIDLPGEPLELPYPPRIVAETDDFLVVDKPPFLRIHPSKPDQTDTLWNELRALLVYEIANGGQVSIINRLDRETSGLVLVAKHRAAAKKFSQLMERRGIGKEYLALAHGWPAQFEPAGLAR